MDNYEKYEDGYVIQPWTEIAERTQYYTEGSPIVVAGEAYSGSKQLIIKEGKLQILHDWGGALYDGYYVIALWLEKKMEVLMCIQLLEQMKSILMLGNGQSLVIKRD